MPSGPMTLWSTAVAGGMFFLSEMNGATVLLEMLLGVSDRWASYNSRVGMLNSCPCSSSTMEIGETMEVFNLFDDNLAQKRF